MMLLRSLVLLALVLTLSCAPEPAAVSTASTEKPKSDATAEAAVQPNSAPGGLQLRLENAIDSVRRREVFTDNAFWTIFHGVLGLGPGLTLTERATGKKYNAVEFMFRGGAVRGMNFVPTEFGVDVRPDVQYVGQGHQDQFLAEVLEWNIPPDTKVVINNRQYTLWDFIHESMARVEIVSDERPKQELSWTIIVVGQHIGTDAVWKNRKGQELHYEQMMEEEVAASINEAACGGTHRLFGLTWAYYLHQEHLKKTKGKATPVWAKVKARLEEHKQLAKKFQNRGDGALSCNYFRGPGVTTDAQQQLGAAGHTLEWLAQYVTDEELKEPWLEDAAASVAKMILDIRNEGMESGALYHAVHGLITYHARRFGKVAKPNADIRGPATAKVESSPSRS